MTRPEQSKPDGDAPPYTYGTPSMLMAFDAAAAPLLDGGTGDGEGLGAGGGFGAVVGDGPGAGPWADAVVVVDFAPVPGVSLVAVVEGAGALVVDVCAAWAAWS